MHAKVLCLLSSFLAICHGLPLNLLYDTDVEGIRYLQKTNDVSSNEITLKVPVVFYGVKYDTIFVNDNGLVSFQLDLPQFINMEFPLDYPIIAPFYSNVDITEAGTISFYETQNEQQLQRATENIRESFLSSYDFEATSIFVVTWSSDESGLPDARAQVGLLSGQEESFILPGSGTEQVKNLERWTNIELNGQFLYRVDGKKVQEPDGYTYASSAEQHNTCSSTPTACHSHARCHDYEEGFCCQCKEGFYGNGKYCVKDDAPIRVAGKVNGKLNGEILESLDLQAYVVLNDGRAYTAISKIPKSISDDAKTLQILGGFIGYLFAKPVRGALNGFQLTGGHCNHSSIITYPHTNQVVKINQEYEGLDVYDQLRVNIHIDGSIPTIPAGAKVDIDEYSEQYTHTAEGVLQMSSERFYVVTIENSTPVTYSFKLEQSVRFDYCPYKNNTVGESWTLKVGRHFINYEDREQIVRFGQTNKVTPIGEYDPCEEGRSKCGPNSSCVVEDKTYECLCNPGYQRIYSGTEEYCADINECQTGLHTCDYNAQCVNVEGSYRCECNPGFEGNGEQCLPAKSCENVTCSENAECVANNDIAACKCLPGFTGNGFSCSPFTNQGCNVNNNCSPYGICSVDAATNRYQCTCMPGFDGDGYNCFQTTSTVSPVPTEPYHNETEEVIDDCRTLSNCDYNAQCEFSDDLQGYVCICNEGYEGDGYHCYELTQSCTTADNCDPHATCTYDEHLGRSRCICNTKYAGDGYNCTLIATCTSQQDCAPTEECAFSNGRYECVCKTGFVRDSLNVCVLNIPTCGGGTCVENAECVYDENYGTHYCACLPGFIGDGIIECKEKPIGCDTLNNCGYRATCQYDEDSMVYVCRCNPGFFGDGYTCFAERNCHVDPSMCDANAQCYSDAERNYICQCNSGYVGNGTVCKMIAKSEGNFLLVNQGMATLRLPIDQNSRQVGRPIQIRPYQTAVGLDIDCLEGRVFWSDVSGKAIRSSFYNGSSKEDFIANSIGSAEGLAVDYVSRNIYWTDSMSDTIEVANLDSRRRRKLFSTDLVNPRGIAVHPQRGKIFWSDWNRLHPKIEWANADGTDRRIFFEGPDVSLPNSLAIDFDTEQLCYTDAGTKKIECIQIDSKQKLTIAVNCTYPFGIAITHNHIYWSDWISKKVERVEKNTLNRLPPLRIPVGGSGNKIFGLVSVPENCRQLANLCQYSRCPEEHICLPDGKGSRSCVCSRSIDDNKEPNCTI
ncbi:hypothetical protein GWI33_000273 [Rhynchophorus ferrugineus]|uniref:Nidogen n=1 Tax=Rhynchophorus ferrugineus TaxID=354439 RepID=A0A834IXA9_RHYFE|nr:hypothetical protein GWI33_000273 [Rhynchophorus ferrugineus]